MIPDWDTVQKEIREEKLLRAREKGLHRFLLVLALFMGVEILLFFFIIGCAFVDQSSMYPEIQNGDFVVYNRLSRTYAPGDIVVIRGDSKDLYYIKRIIALEGDEVALTEDGGITVNGVLLNEPYVHHAPTTEQDISFPQIVPPGRFFVLGDNRTVSKDSRSSSIGMVSGENIKGSLLLSLRLR